MITKEDIITWFTNIHNRCNRITTANYSHDIKSIRSLAFNYADTIKKYYGSHPLYSNFMNIYEICTRVTSGNVSHQIATIKGICIWNIKYIEELEHKMLSTIDDNIWESF